MYRLPSGAPRAETHHGAGVEGNVHTHPPMWTGHTASPRDRHRYGSGRSPQHPQISTSSTASLPDGARRRGHRRSCDPCMKGGSRGKTPRAGRGAGPQRGDPEAAAAPALRRPPDRDDPGRPLRDRDSHSAALPAQDCADTSAAPRGRMPDACGHAVTRTRHTPPWCVATPFRFCGGETLSRDAPASARDFQWAPLFESPSSERGAPAAIRDLRDHLIPRLTPPDRATGSQGPNGHRAGREGGSTAAPPGQLDGWKPRARVSTCHSPTGPPAGSTTL